MKKRVSCLMMLLAAVSISAQDYTSLHDKLIRFYGYQRAGLKSGTSGNLNGQNNHTGDAYNTSPLDGGWYDAGDYIKFGMPLGYAVYCLLKGYDIFPSQYADNYKADNSSGSNGIPDVLDQVKYATDYIMKAVVSENTIIRDVGKGQWEHDQAWGSVPSSGGRTGDAIFTCSGADIPAMYAADLACMAVCYKKFDSTYSAKCVEKAIVAFKFAKNKIALGGENLYCDAQKDGSGNAFYYYYTSKDKGLQRQIADKMVAAGIELYRATNGTSNADPMYRTWAKKGIAENFNVMCYSFIGPLASIEVWRQGIGGGGASSVNQNAGFCGGAIQASGFFTGVYKNAGWGTARDVGSAAFANALAYIVISTKAQRDTLLNRVKNHVAWDLGTFGQTKQCYVVGMSGGPSNIHYRPNKSGPPGGLVSGPDGDGKWSDDGGANYTEVALDYNAGITGAVAFLKAITGTGGTDIKISSPFAATPSSSVDFSKQTVAISATFSKSVAWTLKIVGAFGDKTITKTGTSISETWDGSADKGFFLSGETVAAQLSIDGTIAAIDIVSAKALEITIAKAKKLQTTASDVLVDNFDDADTVNKLGGNWIPFGSEVSFAGKTLIAFDTLNGSKAIKTTCNVTSDLPTTYAGVKATLNAAGTPTTMGGAKSIVFDLRGNKEANIRVELAQSTITDSAYWGVEVPITTLSNTYRVNISDFKQPSWKIADKPLDLNSISGVRFAVYDSTGRIDLYLDNVYVENLGHSPVKVSPRPAGPSLLPFVKNKTLYYRMPFYAVLPFDMTISDIAGRIVMKRTLRADPGEMVSVSLSPLPTGIYTVRHSANGQAIGGIMKINHVR
jgi:endoglucanase